MTYRFKLNESVSAGASRIGMEQIDIAEARLASRDDIPTAIHDARRCLKRLRALLRLIRPALAESTYRREANRDSRYGLPSSQPAMSLTAKAGCSSMIQCPDSGMIAGVTLVATNAMSSAMPAP